MTALTVLKIAVTVLLTTLCASLIVFLIKLQAEEKEAEERHKRIMDALFKGPPYPPKKQIK